MKSLFILIISMFFLQSFAQAEVRILDVSIQTPLPTGLESAAMSAPKAASFPEMVFSNKNVKPLLDAAAELHKDKIASAIAVGGAFYQEGYAEINCDENVVMFFTPIKDSCTFTLTKSFGWYADIELAFVVTGFALESDIPAGTQMVKDGKFQVKQ